MRLSQRVDDRLDATAVSPTLAEFLPSSLLSIAGSSTPTKLRSNIRRDGAANQCRLAIYFIGLTNVGVSANLSTKPTAAPIVVIHLTRTPN
jgi:hypothetical protein